MAFNIGDFMSTTALSWPLLTLSQTVPCAFFRWGNWSSAKLNNLSEDSECIDTTVRFKPTYCGADIYTLLYIKQIVNKNPLYGIGNSTQYMGIEC